MTLKNLGMSEAQYYGIQNDKWNTTLGEFITGIFLWTILIQIVVYFILFFYHLYITIRKKNKDSFVMIKIFSLAILLCAIWIFLTLALTDNGKYELLWGPADTGLFFVSMSSLFINYLIFSYNMINSIVSPVKLYKLTKENSDSQNNL
jgi:hypothetical protein